MDPRKQLLFEFVPILPMDGKWFDICRWLIAVMDRNDASIAVVASVMSEIVTTRQITDESEAVMWAILDRVKADWISGRLECQEWERAVG